MPANLSAPYLDAEERYKAAKDPDEKLLALREMLALIPKHKGTEKLQADIKTKIAKLTDAVEKQAKKGGRKDIYTVPREGASQVVLLGPTNSGKSELLAACTNAQPEIGDWPYTTQLPLPGMMPVLDILIQIVDLPAIDPERTDNWVPNLARYADAALVVLDASRDDILDQLRMVEERLSQSRIGLASEAPRTGPEDVFVKKRAGIALNKIDEPGAEERADRAVETLASRFQVIKVSAFTGAGIPECGPFLFGLCRIIRVYSKQPGKEPDMAQPFILPKGATVLDMAKEVHKDFVAGLKFARVWGSSRIPGLRMPRDGVLEDGDVVELHL